MINEVLFQQCNASTELVFKSIDHQFLQMENKLHCDEMSMESVSEGDVFVTKHSNLLQTHVVFHLVADTEGIACMSFT